MSAAGFRVEGDVLAATTREAIGGIADQATATSAPIACLFQDAAAGKIAFAKFERADAKWPARLAENSTRPVVMLIGDDPWPRGESLGPTGWKAADRLRRWARSVIVHGSAGLSAHYRMASAFATQTGRCAFIETDSDHALEWAAYMGRSRTTLILPPEGQRHPSPPDRRGMH